MAATKPSVSKFNGLRTDAPPDRVGLDDLVETTNVYVENEGGISRRPGMAKLLSLVNAHSLWHTKSPHADGKHRLFWIDEAGLKCYDEDLNGGVLSSSVDKLAPMTFLQVDSTVYATNGISTYRIEMDQAIALARWGIPIPPSPRITIQQGSMAGGRYQVALAWVDADGRIGPTSLTTMITVPENSCLSIDLPLEGSGLYQCAVYCTNAGGDQLYQDSIVPDGASVLLTIDPNTLHMVCRTQFTRPPVPGRILAHYRGRIYVARDRFVYYSEPLSHDIFQELSFKEFDGEVTMIAPCVSGFFIGTKDRTYWVEGDKPLAMSIVECDSYGPSYGSLTYVPGVRVGDGQIDIPIPFWMTRKGFRSGLPGGQVTAHAVKVVDDTVDYGVASSSAVMVGNNSHLLVCSVQT